VPIVGVAVHDAKQFIVKHAAAPYRGDPGDAPKPLVCELLQRRWKLPDLSDPQFLKSGKPKIDRYTLKQAVEYDRSDAASVGVAALFWRLDEAERQQRRSSKRVATSSKN
jgi:hypothetical protein